MDVAEPGGQVRHGCGGGHPRPQDGGAEDLELLLERPVVDERERLVRPLVDRLPPRRQPGAAQPRGPADVAADLEPVGAVAGLGRLGPGEREPAFANAVERPPGLEPPRARIGLEIGGRGHRTPHERDDRRLAVDAVVLTLQPPVPPARHLAVEVDVGAGARGLDVGVRPGTGQEAFRAGEVRHAAQGDVRVAVGPAGHEHRRRLDRAVVLAQRPVLPERVVPLVLEPAEQPRLVLGDPAFPRVAPTLAGHPRVRRQHVDRVHVGRPVGQVELFQRAAVVVDVVRVPVVGGEDRADRLQRRGAEHRHLQRVEPRPRRPVHADVAVGPRSVGEPGDHLGEVLELLRRVLARRAPLRGARPADVEPAHHVPELVREPVVLGPVVRGEVVLAVGERLEERGARLGTLGVVPRRQVQGGGQADAVAHPDPDVLGPSHGGGC